MLLDEGKITEAQYQRVMDRGVRILKKQKLYEKWLARHDVGRKSSVGSLVKKLLESVELPKKLLTELVEEVVVLYEETGLPYLKKDVPKIAAEKLVEAGMGMLLEGLPEESSKQRVLVCVPKEIRESFDNEEWNKWHLQIDGKKYHSRFKDYEEWGTHYAGKRIDSISGKVTCHSKNIGSSILYIEVVERNAGRFAAVGSRDYKRVGKRKLEKDFAYTVIGIPPGEYLVMAHKRAPGRNLKGEASVTVVAGKRTSDVDIELVDPRMRRKKVRVKTEGKRKRIKR